MHYPEVMYCFILGFSMSSIALAVFMSNIGDAHLVPYNTQWARYTCSSVGALFIFLSSIAKTHEQLGQLKRAQIISAAVFVVVIALTPVLPPFSSPLIPATIKHHSHSNLFGGPYSVTPISIF